MFIAMKDANLHTYRGFFYMNNSWKVYSPWTQLGIFLGLLGGAWILTVMAGGAILFAKVGLNDARHIDVSDPRLTGTLKGIQAISTILLFGLPAYLYAVITSREKPLPFLGFRPARLPVFYALGVMILLLSFPLEGWLGQLNRSIHLPQSAIEMEKAANRQISAFLKASSPMDIVINVFVIALLPAVFEEACFRGALQRILIQLFRSPWAGIIVTGAFFSAFHMQFQGFLPRMFLGILLGAVYWYSGSLWASILAHFVTNAAQVIAVSYYPKMLDEDPAVPLYWALISLVIVVGLLSVLRRRSTTNYAEVYARKADEYDGFAD
jgi:membrane protease YdiL (CAAX protease family)